MISFILSLFIVSCMYYTTQATALKYCCSVFCENALPFPNSGKCIPNDSGGECNDSSYPYNCDLGDDDKKQ